MITFKAQYIKPVTVQKKVYKSEFQNKEVSLVEFDTKSENDLITLNSLNCYWDNCRSLLHEITKIFNKIYYNDKEKQDEHFFAITEQKKDFDFLDETLILGVLQTRRLADNTLEIENLQVSPETNFNSVVRNYKYVGRALLESVKDFFPKDKTIVLNSLRSAMPFYRKYGFKNIDPHKMIFKR